MLLANVALMIPPKHPAREQLRRVLTNGRARRGLITPQQANEQRQIVRQVLSNGRRDYRTTKLTE